MLGHGALLFLKAGLGLTLATNWARFCRFPQYQDVFFTTSLGKILRVFVGFCLLQASSYTRAHTHIWDTVYRGKLPQARFCTTLCSRVVHLLVIGKAFNRTLLCTGVWRGFCFCPRTLKNAEISRKSEPGICNCGFVLLPFSVPNTGMHQTLVEKTTHSWIHACSYPVC